MSTTHGYTAYSHGCRCGDCRAAKAAYQRERRAAAYLPGEIPAHVKHGTRSTYEEHGCRCGPCRASQVKRHHMGAKFEAWAAEVLATHARAAS